MANLSSRQQRRIRHSLAQQLAYQDKRRKIDPFDYADLGEPSSTRDASTSEQLPHKNDSDLNDSDLNHQRDHGDIFVDEFANFDEANDYPDCSSELNLEVNNAYDKDSCGNDDILESTSDESNTLCTDSDYEAGLTNDVSTSSSSEGLTVSDESDNSSDNNEGADDDSEQTGCEATVSKLLYHGASVSKHEFAVTFLTLIYHHKLTYSCGADVLKFLSQILPVPNSVSQSFHTLLKELVNYNDSTVAHCCCGYCTQPSSDQSGCKKPECIAASLPDSTFVELILDKQLHKLFSGK